MGQKKIFASFILDRQQEMEIALPAEFVREAILLTVSLKFLPSAIDFLEGIMEFRGGILPVINLKKRLKLSDTTYGPDCRIAVVQIHDQQCGLIVDDINDVLWVSDSDIIPVNPALQSEDRIISSFIKKSDSRIFEIVDLRYLFPEGGFESAEFPGGNAGEKAGVQRNYSRFVAFMNEGQEYGLPVENARGVTFLSGLNETFQNGIVAGDIKMRGRSIPVVNASCLLSDEEGVRRVKEENEERRILIFSVARDILAGLIVDSLVGIIAIPDDEILLLPGMERGAKAAGIYQEDGSRNMILLNIEELVLISLEELKSVANISSGEKKSGDYPDQVDTGQSRQGRQVISLYSYLIVSIGRNFAFQLGDVREIVEAEGVMHIPGALNFSGKVVNLRGEILPVISLREFYSFPDKDQSDHPGKLVVCHSSRGAVAFEVDSILTIYKQENYYQTPALNSQLDAKRDTLDRLIEFAGNDSGMEHVLVVNVNNLVNNHLNIYKKEDVDGLIPDNPQDDQEKKGDGGNL